MENKVILANLGNAVELIKMLEHLTSGLAAGVRHHELPPWAGIQFTLSQCKDLILLAKEELHSSELSSDGLIDEAVRLPVSAPRVVAQNIGSTLASRIQQAPTSAGRVRELINNVSAATSINAANNINKVRSNEVKQQANTEGNEQDS